MSTLVAVSSFATTQAVIASQRAREAECRVIVDLFKSDSATVSKMQEYASCVQTMYPSEMSDGSVLLIKALIISAIIGFVLGLIKSSRDTWSSGFVEYFVNGIAWMLLLPFSLLFLYLASVAVMFLFS